MQVDSGSIPGNKVLQQNLGNDVLCTHLVGGFRHSSMLHMFQGDESMQFVWRNKQESGSNLPDKIAIEGKIIALITRDEGENWFLNTSPAIWRDWHWIIHIKHKNGENK